jgi:hypothetical protein
MIFENCFPDVHGCNVGLSKVSVWLKASSF